MIETSVLMSLSQQGMYFDSQLRAASDYHLPLHFRIEPLAPERVERAVRQVVAEQPALRSAVRGDKSGVAYLVADTVAPPLVFHDLRGREQEIDAIAAEAARTPFDLGTAPLFRVVHCRLAAEDRMIIVCHHLIADGISAALLGERIVSLVRGDDADGEPAAPDTGFLGYQRKQGALPEKKAAAHAAFWRANLAKQEAPDLAHWMGPDTESTVGKELRLPLDASLRQDLSACAREAEVSENTLYLGVFGLLLAHYAHTDHVSVAAPFVDRPGLETERSIGCFIKTLPVHIDAGPEQTVRAMLERLRTEVLGNWKHLAYSPAALLSEYPALHRVYDITFIEDRYPEFPAGVLGAVRQEPACFPGKFTVLVEQVGDDAALVFQYKASALTEDKVDRFAQRYLALLQRIPDALDAPVAELQPLVDPASAQLLEALAQTHHYDWEPAHLSDLFLAKTASDPARIAWSDDTRDYTNAWAHDAAVLVQRRLLDAVGRQGAPVAVLLPRGADLLAGVFGTMLAGCSYVPLSEDMPARRTAEILQDAAITVVLTTSVAALALPAGVTRLDLDRWDDYAALRGEHRAAIGETAAEVERRPDDVLYIEYTSGSTGRPKGVMVTHANVQNTAMDLERRFPLGPDDAYLLKTSFTFDIFGTEAYGWLFGEGRLEILPVGHEGDAPALLTAVRDRRITHLNCSPTMLRVLLDAADAADRASDFASLRYLFSGGEALTADIVERFFSLPLTCTLENVYGPTEATMWATHGTVTAADTDPIAPIGTPLNDYRIHLIGRDGGPCGIDMPGEVAIAGAGVALGYLNRDELNAERFTENPWFDPAADPDHMRRLYRTGDLGLLRPDGRFAFIRRIDRQVKVGGVRMELGEIEQALLRADGVVEAAVLVDDTTAPARLVGCFTARPGTTVDDVRAALAQRLMPQMIPSPLVRLDALPTSAAGKLDRRALRETLATAARTAAPPTTPAASPVQERIADIWRRLLGSADIDAEASFFEQGGNSLSLMRLQLELREAFGQDLRITELLKHHSVAAQARLLGDTAPDEPALRTRPQREGAGSGDIAVIGIGIQVPGAADVREFWANLEQGRESITFYSDDELRALGVPESDLRDPAYVKARGRVAGLDTFDDRLFQIAPAEVDVTSPQLRLLYECFWQACEDAGYDPRALPDRVGVFTGGNDDFAWYQRAVLGPANFGEVYQNFTLATNHFLSTRLSYLFDLKGPSMAALAGCSTSLLAVHQAVQSLRAGECDMALAGGVTVELPNEGGYRYHDGMMLSPDGHCRPFDANAAGTVFTNGAALLALKPVDAALRDGDPVYAVIKGSAVGNDGRRKASYTAPSEDGQYETIRAAYESSGIDPSTVTYVEAHGTGTLLGDPIEVASLSRVFQDSPRGSRLLGSVKGNVGHTDSAAGAVGLSKVALSLKHRYLPGTRNFADPNPAAAFESTPFQVTAEGRPWHGERPRAGINSFGVGGTNVHMILEAAPDLQATEDRPYELLQFSAASREALDRTAARVVRHLADHDEVSLSDAALTLRAGRTALPYRKSIVVAANEDRAAWAERISVAAATEAGTGAKTAFLFSGQGNQHHRMGAGLYRSASPAGVLFRQWMDDLIGLLPAGEADEFAAVLYGDEADGRVDQTEWTQFALFSTQFAMTKVLASFGIEPNVLIGHSIGELTAAALAGVWSLEDAARLVRARGKLMQAQEPGVMIAAAAPAERVRAAVADLPGVWLALDNSAGRCVLGMRGDAFGHVVDRLEAEGIRGTKLQTSHAFHTPMMHGAAESFAALLSGVTAKDPSIPIIANRTGRLVRAGEMTDPAYWSEHLTEPVRFTESLRTLLADGPLHGIELGPGQSLSTFAAQDPQRRPDQVFVNVLRHAVETVEDEPHLLGALGRLWAAGLPIDWRGHGTGRRISLPGYAFDPISHPQDLGTAAAPAPRQAPRMAPTDALDGIRGAFREVLGYPEVAADADFFALGGDSLKATGLAAHLVGHAGLDVTVADIFAHPTPAALAARFGTPHAIATLPKAPPAADHPLSPAQTRMYIAAKMDPDQLIYNMPSATLLDGALDPERVRLALRRLVARHEPLRTTFTARDGEIRQRVAPELPELPLSFHTADLTAEGAVDDLMARFVRPFDLEHGPLFRMAIVDGGAQGSLLLFDVHHIVADAVAAEVIARDFSRLHTETLEPLPLQYTDFVAHARQTDLAESEAHLLAGLADAPQDELLTPDHPRGERQAAADRVALRLDAARFAGLKSLAERRNATPFMAMLAAWGAVLARYADADDLLIGAPVTGRTMAETREMIGMFVNMMPIRLRPGATDSFGEYLARSRETVLDALAHQDVPFDRLVERLNLPRTVGRHPLVDISLDYHNIDHHDVRIDGITARELELRPLAVGMDLVITCTEADDGLTVHLDYAADLFERATIEALAGHFEQFLARVCADDSLPPACVPLYSDAAHRALLPRPDTAPFAPIHEAIAAAAAAAPEATAVIDADGTRYTYRELEGLAGAQAARLRAAGLSAGDPVALFTVRDVNLLIAQLAILKAGGAYVPLDPAQPQARLERIIADIGPKLGFAPASLAAASRIDTVIDIATCKDAAPAGFDAPAVGPDSPIYIVHTSGSTGRPKGIAVKHRGVANLLRDHRERALFGPGEAIISLADPTFDIFTFESLIPLASGATVHMCPNEDQRDAAAIAARIAAHDITHLQLPVSKMAALCGNRRFRSQLHRLRVIVCGGEHFPDSLLAEIHEATDARVFNMYGPTETTVTATVKEFAPGDAVTIGSAVSGAAVLAVSEHGMIQPDGVPGELCIAGAGLALGYTNNPEEQRRAFTAIAELPDLPVYRTKDVGVRLANDEFVLKGRLDHQVKVHGNRIELGEVEKTAMGADGVAYAVAAVEDGDLVLYYSAAADRTAAIRTAIAQALPAYMLPVRFDRRDEMPRLPNGKVDRGALRGSPPAPEPAALPVSASTVLERILAAWEAVLERPVRPTDNFFDVGGNSYKLMLVGNRLDETLGGDLPLVRLFENPTPQSLADTLEAPAAERPATAEATITRDDLAGFDVWETEAPPADERKIAVIGIAGVLPGAADIAEHWDNRAKGIVSTARFTREELLAAGIDAATADDPDYVNARGFVAADTFDADFFGYSAKDAETMDPQLRLLHETAWHALEDAGYVPGRRSGDIGLFVGSGTNFAWMAGFLSRKDDPIGVFEAMTMNEKDFLATKIAYKLDLTGPAVTVQTACSTSLVAIHEAVQSLRRGESDMALAGGVALNFPRKEGYTWHEGMIFSKDGVCRPFSDDADGTVAGQGCGVVLLKPLHQALADGDHVYGVIAGSAVNNDGNRKVGYTAPSVQGQKDVIRAALDDAGADADDIGFVETHGTGTDLGDPIEYEALASVYGKAGPCALGAAKANIGHLDAAAGVAGFIGAVGVLHRGEIPPMANFGSLNGNIIPSGRLYVPAERVAGAGPRKAAVSSFGIGGTNAHLILEPAPAREAPETDAAGEHLYPVSARTERSRRRMQVALDGFHRTAPVAADVSHTLAVGRAEFDSRAAAIGAPGRPLEWIEPSDPPLAFDASDDARPLLAAGLLDDPAPVGEAVREAVERELRVFDAGLRNALSKALFEDASGDPAIGRLAQFVIRVVLIRVAGAPSLHAPAGSDRLLRIARAFAQGDLDPDEAMQALKSGHAPRATAERPDPEPDIMDGSIDARLLRRVLASRWVHGGDVPRSRFCATGKRIPLPGYAFEPRRFTADIRLSDLGLATEPTIRPQGTDDALRAAWIDVLGSEPADEDDFLRSGGDSLAAVRFCTLIEQSSGRSLTVGEVFADARYTAIRRLLAARSAPEPVPAPEAPTPVPAATAPLDAPASPAQQRMYAVCAMQQDTTAYNLAIAYEVTGRLDAERLTSVFRRLTERHDQLRTSFHLDGGALVQRVAPEVPDIVAVVETSQAEAEARLAAEPRPFDLATAPLMRVEALSIDGEIRYLLIDMHHIIGDQQSLAILADDIAEALQGKALGPAPMRYADYAATVAEREADGSFDADVAFFTTLLGDDLPRLELPTDRTPPEPASFDGARRTLVCAADRQAVADLARRAGATPYMVFLAGLTRILGLYSGQREFVIGTAVSGRTLPGTDTTVGMFANTLPLKVTDDARRTVVDAVAGARNDALAVLEHRDAPFEAVLSALDLHPAGDAHPLFDVLFNYVNTGTEELRLDGVRLEPLPPGRIKSRYALSFSVAEREHDFSVDIEYRTELFDDRTIARIAAQLDHLLLAMTRESDRAVAALRLEPDDEHRRRRAALAADGPAIDTSLLDRIRASFAEHADRPAFRWNRTEWTYAEVDRLTDDLAGGLQAAGVGQGDFVLCLLERGPWQVCTRLALMKCGAVEIPMDPQAPAERIAHTLADSGATTAVCSDLRAHPWPEYVTAHRPELLHGTYRAPAAVTADSPLTMIYTSGTTGQPKGTLVTHGGVLSTCTDNGYTDYRPGERILHLTGYTFDPSMLDIYSAFLAGATLVMGGQELNLDVKLLADFLRDERIDKGILITAVFHLLMAEQPEAVAGMSALYVGGEAMQPWAAKLAFDVLGPGGLYNLYGPTEASICTTYFRVDEAPDFQRMPIGVPARNRELYILHPDGTDVPRGVPGELCVAGPSVALGYHRRPELTAEKFTDGTDRGRLYRTGDRVVLDDADRIVYIDRIDQQVKHAGHRIELSEVELAVQSLPGVVEAVVIHTAEQNDSRLSAFYTGESAPAETELRRLLLEKLPRYMVPQGLTRMRELPLTSHGKVDRKLLAAKTAPEPAAPAAQDGADPTVLAAFRDILGVPDLTAADDLFLAGAQSLQAIAVVRRLRESGMALEVADLYRNPTAAALSAVVRPAAEPAAAPVREDRRTLPATEVRQMVDWAAEDARRVAAAFADRPAGHRFDLGAVARLHRSSGAETGGFMHTLTGVDAADAQAAVAALAARHEALRTRIDQSPSDSSEADARFAVIEPDAVAGLSALVPVRDLRRLDAAQVRQFNDALAHTLQADPFTEGLLWRCVIVRESEQTLRLIWAFHHGVFDGFSAGILRTEAPRLARGERLPEARPYRRFLESLTAVHDWRTELDAFDHDAWLAANRAVTTAVRSQSAALHGKRLTVPLHGHNPLELAFATVHAQLSDLTGGTQVAVGLVTDCRRWQDEDYTDCVGEFLDVVPVLLSGDGDQPAAAERLTRARAQGLHYVHALTNDPAAPPGLRAAYRSERGTLALALLNFQGRIDTADMPEGGPDDGPALAPLHLNAWHDDDSLHLEWITDPTRDPAGDPA